MLGVNTTFESPLIQYLARDAAGRCNGPGSFHAIAAVVLSYTAFESFLNELYQHAETTIFEGSADEQAAHFERHPEEILGTLRSFVFAMRVAVEYRARSEDRYDLAWEAFTGQRPKTGEGSRQRLSVLTKLRNDLVHMKSARTHFEYEPTEKPRGFSETGQWGGLVVERHPEPKYFGQLKSWKLMPHDYPNQSWVNRISTAEIARWACDTVEVATHELIQQLPAGTKFRDRIAESALHLHVPDHPADGSAVPSAPRATLLRRFFKRAPARSNSAPWSWRSCGRAGAARRGSTGHRR